VCVCVCGLLTLSRSSDSLIVCHHQWSEVVYL